MASQQYALGALPANPEGRNPQVRRAWRYLKATHESVNGLIDSFNVVHEKKVATRANAQGRLGRDELDLLRAALVFTSSGLDAACHALVAESVPILVDRPGSVAAMKFDGYIDEQLANPSKEFRAALKAKDPRTQLVRLYVEAKTKASYQGSGDLKDRVRDLLGVSNKALPARQITALDGFFTARNDIVHRLDYVEPQGPSVARHGRSPGDVVQECDRVLAVIAGLITGAAHILKSK